MRTIVCSLTLLWTVTVSAAPTGINANQIRTAQPNAVNVSGVSVAEGNSIGVVRADHQHPLVGILPQASGGTGSSDLTCPTGQVLTSNGTIYTCIAAAISVYTRATVPTCDATTLAREIRVHDTGQADETWACVLRDATYIWASFSQAANSTVAIMPNGTLFVTAGGTFTAVGHALTRSGTVLGPASSYFGKTWGGWAGNCTPFEPLVYNGGAISFSVGSTTQFNRVRVRMDGQPWTIMAPSPTYTYWGWQHAEVGSSFQTTPYATQNIIGGQKYFHVKPGSGVNIPFTYVGTVQLAYGFTDSQFGPWLFNTFGNSGEIRWTLSTFNRGQWTKGWSTATTGGSAPAGINTDDYYWISIYYVMGGAYCPGYSYGGLLNNTAIRDYNPAPFTLTAEAVYDDG
jgi:hypothetical protein